MDGFINLDQKQNIRNIVDKIHFTFARTIIAYKEGKKTSVQTNPKYNSFYKRSSDEKVRLSQNSKEIQARIQYKDLQQRDFFQGSAQEKINIPEGKIYIIVNVEDYLFVKESRVVEIDGKSYAVNSPGLALGMFGPQYYKFSVIPLEV
jgi:hypothetical protein